MASNDDILNDILGDPSWDNVDGEGHIPRIPHMLPGIVLSRNDPEGLGRLKVRVDGLFDDGTDWLIPLTMNGGFPGRGRFNPPVVGSLVTLWFPLGEVGIGFYISTGWLKKSDVPSGALVDGDMTRSVEENGQWLMIFDDIESQGEWTIKHKTNGSYISFFENGNVEINPGTSGTGELSAGAVHRVVLGEAVLSYFNTAFTGLIALLNNHIHTVVGAATTHPTAGPPSPAPIFPPFPTAALSSIWKVS